MAKAKPPTAKGKRGPGKLDGRPNHGDKSRPPGPKVGEVVPTGEFNPLKAVSPTSYLKHLLATPDEHGNDRSHDFALSWLENAKAGKDAPFKQLVDRIDGPVVTKIEYVISNPQLVRMIGEITARFIEGDAFDEWARMVGDALNQYAGGPDDDAAEAGSQDTA